MLECACFSVHYSFNLCAIHRHVFDRKLVKGNSNRVEMKLKKCNVKDLRNGTGACTYIPLEFYISVVYVRTAAQKPIEIKSISLLKNKSVWSVAKRKAAI